MTSMIFSVPFEHVVLAIVILLATSLIFVFQAKAKANAKAKGKADTTSALATNDATQGETKTPDSAETTETKTTPVSFYTNLLQRPDHISPSVFAKSVHLSKEGIKRNKYNHHKGIAQR